MRLDANLEASRRTLREAMVNLRDARLNSCKFRQGQDCDLVALSDVELALLDFETKYLRLSRTAAPSADADKFKKVVRAADEARQKVSDLEDLLR